MKKIISVLLIMLGVFALFGCSDGDVNVEKGDEAALIAILRDYDVLYKEAVALETAQNRDVEIFIDGSGEMLATSEDIAEAKVCSAEDNYTVSIELAQAGKERLTAATGTSIGGVLKVIARYFDRHREATAEGQIVRFLLCRLDCFAYARNDAVRFSYLFEIRSTRCARSE